VQGKETRTRDKGKEASGGSTDLAVKRAGLVARDIEFDVLLIHTFVTVHAVLLGVVPHRMIPPIEQWKRLGLVDRIAIVAPGIFLDETTGDVIDLPVSMQGIEHQKKTGFMIVMFVDAGTEIRLDRKEVLGPARRM
jgi:hypothetical protein